MSGTGVNFVDYFPLPEKTNAVTDPDQREVAHAIGEKPSASHALAQAEPEVKGHAQANHAHEVNDLGWNEPPSKIPAPLVGGLGNEELWLLVRRFNMQMYHVKEVPSPVPGNLDLNIADEDEFSPDKLRSVLERLYMTVIISLIGFGKHIARLRSWREKRRTAGFAAAYAIAWFFDLLIPLFATTLIVLIAYHPSRPFLFPPAPIALVDGKTGGVQKPKAGVLGSTDSATGAPQNLQGEAVEQEAQNFVNGIASVAISSAAGKHPMDEPTDTGNPGDSAPDPTSMATASADARQVAAGGDPNTKKDKTKVPMENAMWTKMRPAMHALGDVADTWERFANALSPTRPFPLEPTRMRMAGVVVPLLAVSLVTSSYIFMKGVTFGIGFGFFGDPVTRRGLEWLNSNYPNWQKLLELRNTLLKGVPTNAQLTITLLRIGESNKAPLPPPPRLTDAPPNDAVHIGEGDIAATGEDAPLGATHDEVREAMRHDPSIPHETSGHDVDAAKHKSHGKKGQRILGLFKGTIRGGVESALGIDHVKASAGSTPAKNRLGAIQPPRVVFTSGPVDFVARYHGKKGHLYISAKATIPCVSFTTDHSVENIGSQERDDLHPVWSVAIADIKEIKKVGGFGWKAKLVVGWALERQVNDGIEITDKRGNVWKATAIPLRDELFNRLVAMGGQKWESW